MFEIEIIIIALLTAAVLTRLRYNSKLRKYNKGYTVYVIAKGQHYSHNVLWPLIKYKLGFAKQRMQFYVMFAEGMQGADDGSGDINKLYGMTLGFNVHYRSVRIGWRYDHRTRRIQLFAYVYHKGIRLVWHLCNIAQYEEVLITLTAGSIVIHDQDKQVIGRRDWLMDTGWPRFKCYPYYGGNKPSPVGIKILIREV